MTGTRMMGVVLWCDVAQAKAVIWCEDHGKLAYYTPGRACAHEGDRTGAVAGLDAGDLIRFDLCEDEQLRYAHNPEVLSGPTYPYLAQALSSAPEASPSADAQGQRRIEGAGRRSPANSDTVIDFAKAQGVRLRASA